MTQKNTTSVTTSDKEIIHTERSLTNVLYPLIFSVFAVYLTMGISLGILPGFIKNDLQFGNLAIGITIGLQSLAALLTRAYAGKITDTLGAKVSNHRGVFLIFMAGLIYISAGYLAGFSILALGLLIISRIIHGIGESMLVTGALTWGIGLLGVQNSGKVMTWNGIAMYAGIALGAPLSIWLKDQSGIIFPFALIAVLSIVSRLLTGKLAVISADALHIRIPFYKVVGKVLNQGMALAFSSIGFACIASFIALLFADKNWSGASLAFLCFGGFYIATRLFFASYPDKFGGYKVAIVSFTVEIIGQLLIGLSTSGWMTIVGCALTGIGFSLVFPALGVLAIKKVQPQMRGTALGAYSAFFDLSLGVAGPVAGLIAGWFNYQSIYLFGAISGLSAIFILFKDKSSGR
jgi:MFS family permease